MNDNPMEMVIYQLFSINSSFKATAKLVIDNNKEKNFNPTIKRFMSGNNRFTMVVPNPYIEININSPQDRKNGALKIKKMNFMRRDIHTMVIKLRELVKVLFSDNQLFYYDKNRELKVNHQMAEKVKLVHQNNSNHLEMRPIVAPIDNKMYEGVIYTYGLNYENYTFLTSYDVQYLLSEFERINLTDLGMQMLNLYFNQKDEECGTIDNSDNNDSSNRVTLEKKSEDLIDVKPILKKDDGGIPKI